MPESLAVAQLGSLYELALSIGRSLDLEETCQRFLDVLVSRQTLDFASVWLTESSLDPDRASGSEALVLVSANPRYRFDVERRSALPSIEQVTEADGSAGFLLMRCEPNSGVPERLDGEADVATFGLGGIGLLRLASGVEGRLDERECRKLLRLVERFSSALAACLSHARAVHQSNERERLLSEGAATSDLLSTLCDSLSVGVLVLSGDFRILRANARFQGIFGGAEADHCALAPDGEDHPNPLTERVAPRIRDGCRFADWLDRVLSGGAPESITGLETVDGKILDIDYSPFGTDLDRAGHLLQFRDVTDDVQARARVEESEKRHRLLIGNALDAVITMDLSGAVIDWNPSAEATFGYTSESAMGKRLADLIVPEMHRANHEQGLARYRETGDGPVLNQRFEIEALHADGHHFPIELTIYPVNSGDETTFTAFCRDITERRVIEKMKDELVSTVSHELRTPLTSMQGFVELLLAREFEPDRQKEFLRIVHDESVRLERLVSDLLDVQRLESGVLEYDMTSVDLARLAEEMVELFQVNPDARSISLKVEGELLPIQGDPDRLRQVLANLLSNAVKFSDAPAEIVVRLARRADAVHLSVEDQGMGIPEEDVAKISEKFFRSGEARARAIGGSGLGLALVEQIVQKHGASLEISSTLGEGSRFSIDFPLGVT